MIWACLSSIVRTNTVTILAAPIVTSTKSSRQDEWARSPAAGFPRSTNHMRFVGKPEPSPHIVETSLSIHPRVSVAFVTPRQHWLLPATLYTNTKADHGARANCASFEHLAALQLLLFLRLPWMTQDYSTGRVCLFLKRFGVRSSKATNQIGIDVLVFFC